MLKASAPKIKARVHGFNVIKKGDAAKVARELTRLAKQTGTLTPQQVLNAAKSRASVLHKYIDWNDRSAAEKYRLHQARQILGSIEIEIIDENGKAKPVRAFHHVSDADNGPHYEMAQFAFRKQNVLSQLRARARVELSSWIERYAIHAELADAVRAARKALSLL